MAPAKKVGIRWLLLGVFLLAGIILGCYAFGYAARPPAEPPEPAVAKIAVTPNTGGAEQILMKQGSGNVYQLPPGGYLHIGWNTRGTTLSIQDPKVLSFGALSVSPASAGDPDRFCYFSDIVAIGEAGSRTDVLTNDGVRLFSIAITDRAGPASAASGS